MEFEELVASQPKILVVDDLVSARKIISRFLGKLGFTHVEEAVDGADAIKKLKASGFDVIISDWEMPNLSGLELFRSIKDTPIRPKGCIMVTPVSSREQVLEAVEAGVDEYVLKPFDENILKAKLSKIFAKVATVPISV